MKIMNACIAAAALFAAGCASYSWKASVPEDMRTVDVPVFRNESSVTELGGEMSAHVSRLVIQTIQKVLKCRLRRLRWVQKLSKNILHSTGIWKAPTTRRRSNLTNSKQWFRQ